MASHTPTALSVERLTEPLHVWTQTPRFGWQLAGEAGNRQTAYELEVIQASDGAVVASTGRVVSSASHSVVIPDVNFQSRTRFDWRVRVWIDDGSVSEWARSSFETTVLDPAEWVARWIEPHQQPVTAEAALAMDAPQPASADTLSVEERLHPSPLLRQSFVLDRLPERARLYITARGVYEVTVNGQAITDEVLAPGYDEHPKRLSYQTYDTTPQLRVGENVIGIRLADGWWAGRISFTGSSANYGDMLGVLWQLEGDRRVIAASDTTARSAHGETRYADIFIGEKMDARLVVTGWDEPGFDDSAWSPAHLSDRATESVVPFVGEPVRRVDEIHEPRILTTPAGDLIVDLGQNIAGRLRLTARGDRGTTIVLEHTESLDRHGNYQQNIMGRNKDQTDVWVLAGEEAETYEPRFTFHGFRYVRVTGYPGELRPEDVVGVVLASDLPYPGRFVTDNARINRLHENVVWSQRGNFLSIPTDCPQRERAGWTGDVQVFARAAANNARVDLFFERWLANVRAAQSKDGAVPMIVPYTPSFAETMGASGMGSASSGWGDVITILPLALYERYGDERVLAENYEAMRNWIGWVRERAEKETAEEYLDLPESDPVRRRQALLWNTGFHFGDWLVPSTVTTDQSSLMVAAQLTGALFGSAFYFHSVSNLARAAEILGDRDTADEMRTLADRIREAFIAEYVHEDGRLSVHMQGAYVIVLAFDLLPADRRGGAGRHLVQLIHDAGDHLDTGFLSVPHLLDVLTSLGERDLAYTLLFQDTAPSWLYEVDMGATTIWESWSGVEPDGQPRDMSLNHYAFGVVDDWIFRQIAGIRPAQPGYAEIEFAPDLASPFGSVTATVGTPYGEAGIEWTKAGAGADVIITVPGNTNATLRLPDHDPVRFSPGRQVVHAALEI